MSADKIFMYAPFVILILFFLSALVLEALGCQWGELFRFDTQSLFVPGIKVIG